MFLVSAIMAEPLEGQMFGQRSMGQPVTRQSRPGGGQFPSQGQGMMPGMMPGMGGAMPGQVGGAQQGIVQGQERFLRGNRNPQAFVGSDRRDQQGFVGSEQSIGTGRVATATEGMRVESSRTRNRPLSAKSTRGMYPPRLVLDESFYVPIDGAESAEEVPTEPIDTEGYAGDTGARRFSTPRASVNRQIPTVRRSSDLHSRMQRIGGPQVRSRLVGGTMVLEGAVESRQRAELLANVAAMEPGVDRVENRLKFDSR
jgi:hypothetical protein